MIPASYREEGPGNTLGGMRKAPDCFSLYYPLDRWVHVAAECVGKRSVRTDSGPMPKVEETDALDVGGVSVFLGAGEARRPRDLVTKLTECIM